MKKLAWLFNDGRRKVRLMILVGLSLTGIYFLQAKITVIENEAAAAEMVAKQPMTGVKITMKVIYVAREATVGIDSNGELYVIKARLSHLDSVKPGYGLRTNGAVVIENGLKTIHRPLGMVTCESYEEMIS